MSTDSLKNSAALSRGAVNPTPEQVAQWAREADCGFGVDGGVMSESVVGITALTRLVTRAMAEQAEADAKLCDFESEQWNEVAKDSCSDGRYDWKADGAEDCAAAIRANAPKATT